MIFTRLKLKLKYSLRKHKVKPSFILMKYFKKRYRIYFPLHFGASSSCVGTLTIGKSTSDYCINNYALYTCNLALKCSHG